jgi:hypothetical protein
MIFTKLASRFAGRDDTTDMPVELLYTIAMPLREVRRVGVNAAIMATVSLALAHVWMR